MREYCLDELFDLQMGKTPSRNNSAYWNDGSNDWISIGDLSGFGKYVGETKEQLTDLAVSESGIKPIPVDTVVMSFKLSIGKLAITTEEIYSNEAIMAFIDKEVEKISPDYLYYLLLNKDWNEGTNKAVMGKTLNKATLSKVKIKLHELSEQEEIVLVLDKANKLITLRKQQLEDLDDLIKSRFVEMFGDPLTNPMGWEEVVITELCEKICGGGTPSKSHPEYFEGHIPWVSPKDMKSMVIRDSQDHITEEAIENSSTNIIPENSVLMVIRSGILKHTLPVAINAVPVTINQDMKAFVPGKKIHSAFLMNYFKAVEPNVLSGVRGVTADNIDFKDFQKRMVILPPIDLQKRYATFVKQVDKLKVEVLKSLDETQWLFDSLMQKYFD